MKGPFLLLVAAVLFLIAAATARGQDIYVRTQTPSVSKTAISKALPGLNSGMNDFERWWGGDYTLKRGDAPLGGWQITIRGGNPLTDPGGYHFVGPFGPFGIVYADVGFWQLTLTHEAFELAADPLIERTARGNRLWLVEPADPVEVYSYMRLGVVISDFVGPAWYTGKGRYYDRLGVCKHMEQILPGGYASYWDGAEWAILEQ